MLTTGHPASKARRTGDSDLALAVAGRLWRYWQPGLRALYDQREAGDRSSHSSSPRPMDIPGR